MAALSLDAVAAATGGTVVSGDPGLTVRRYAIDSRAVSGGELFFALVGPRKDGHEFLADVYDRGAAAAVVSRSDPTRGAAVRVTDTTRALRELGARVRQEWGGPVIGITGSCGKTTTKEMLRTVLAVSRPVLATRGNLNNLYGLPLMLLELLPEHQAAVLEMGISTPGEMVPLAAIAGPDVAVLLNIEAVHLAHFDSLDAIADAKGAMLDALRPGGTAVVNADDPRAVAQAERRAVRRITFGLGATADVRAESIQEDEGAALQARVRAGDESADLKLPLGGRHNLMNALAALAAARLLGVPLVEGAAALARFGPPAMRGQRLLLAGGVTLWDESYNSNPAAMRAVLLSLGRARPSGRRVLVCGDMLELGEDEAALHADLAPAVAAAGVDLLLTVGPLSAGLAAAVRHHGIESLSFADSLEAAARVPGVVRDGDLVLIKGSRGTRTDRVVEALLDARAAGPDGGGETDREADTGGQGITGEAER